MKYTKIINGETEHHQTNRCPVAGCSGILRTMEVEYTYKGKLFGKYKAEVCDKKMNHVYFSESSYVKIEKRANELGLWGNCTGG